MTLPPTHIPHPTQRPLRIAFVQSGLQAGGAEKVINLLARHQARQGHDISVVALTGEKASSYFKYPDSIRVISPDRSADPAQGGLRRAFNRLIFLRRSIHKLQPDLIVSFLTKVNVLSLAVALGSRTPLIVAERNNPQKQDASPIWQIAFKLLAGRATGFVMQTDSAVKSLPRQYRTVATVIPNPVVLTVSKPRMTRKVTRVIAVGRLEKQKGFDLLIHAFARIATVHPEANLTIFGQGPERDSLLQLAQSLGIGGHVSLPGVTRQPGDWAEAGDVFVLSSRYEGFPNVLIEAMSFGLPCIAFDCPWGPSDIITDQKDGLLIPDGDVDALAAAMDKMMSKPEFCSQLAQEALLSVRRFESERVLQMWDSAIAKVVQVR